MNQTGPIIARFTDPTEEQVRRNFERRITELQEVVPTLLSATLVAVQRIIASGPYTPTTGATRGVLVQCGGGGAGGGATAVGVSLSVGGGGASGITLVDYLATLSAGTVTMGAAGAPGAPGANGGTGGDTTTTINGTARVAKGGAGGGVGSQSGNPSGSQGAGGALPAGSGPALWLSGENGQDGLITSATGGGLSAGSHGGSGPLGAAIPAGVAGFGAGGMGGAAVNGSVSGLAGGPGVVIIFELA